MKKHETEKIHWSLSNRIENIAGITAVANTVLYLPDMVAMHTVANSLGLA